MKEIVWVWIAISIMAGGVPIHAQEIDSYQSFEFRNIGTGLYMDVTRGLLRPGIKLQLWSGNSTDAQLFEIDALPDTDLHRVHLFSRDYGLLFLTASKPNPGLPVEERPLGYHATLETAAEPPVRGGTDWGMSPEDLLEPSPEQQRWRFEPVQGHADTYVIRSVAFAHMVLTASGSVQGSPLLLRRYEDSPTQHWRSLKQIPDQPEGLSLERFRYFPIGKLRGQIHWHADSDLIDYFVVNAFNNELGNVQSPSLSNAIRSWDIEIEPGPEARDKEWCFSVTAVNHRAGKNLESHSQDVCETARRIENSPVTYSEAIIENCHDDRIDVRIWISVNGQNWQDRGLLESQWSSSGCPDVGTPKTVELENDASNWIKALDSNCGSSSPVDTDGRCHELTTPVLIGSDASENVFRVQLGGPETHE